MVKMIEASCKPDALTRTIPAGQAWLVIVKASATNNLDTNRAAYWKAALVYRPSGGSATRQGSVASVIPDIESDTNWGGVNITISGNDVLATVQGKNGVNINWRVSWEILPNTE
ncbi:MAG: hypothetical protein A2Y81_03010 [Nitrospirae bacterium RBG_13_43_8]|nr:MAG: hypothetical protein A2Y81_03010 [Nitrospirae bacterium RBG_13_43_8]